MSAHSVSQESLTREAVRRRLLGVQPTPSKPLYGITVPAPSVSVRRATPMMISERPKVSIEQALRGYHYLKARSSRKSSQA